MFGSLEPSAYKTIRRRISVKIAIKHTLLLPLLLFFFMSAQAFASKSGDVNDELEQLGTEFAAAIRHGNINAIIAMYDMERTGELVAEQLYDGKKQRTHFLSGFMSNSKETFVKNLFAFQQASSSDATFLKVIETDGEKTPVVRVDLDTGGHDFVHLFAHKNEQGKWQAYDMYVATAGKRVTQKMAENLTFMLNSKSNLLKRLIGVKQLDEELIVAYRELTHHVQQGEIQKAWDIYEQLPEKAKRSRGVLDISLGVAQLLSEELYTQQLELLAKYHGDDPTTLFMLLDYYFTVGEYDKAISGIRAMQDLYGEEAALNNLLANVYYMLNDKEKARAFAKKSRQLEPFFIGAYWTELTLLNEANEHQQMVSLLQTMEQNWDFDFREADFAQDTMYDIFIKSEPFVAWMQLKND